MDKLQNFLNENSELKIMFLCKFGSHLYGTNTKDSDDDFKGIFIPLRSQCFLNRIPKSITYNSKTDNELKNSSEDIDIELYSIHYYLQLLKRGDTGALDILHAKSNLDAVLKTSAEYDYLYDHRTEFYTKNLKAFVGYCRTQAAKYGIKGSRLNDAKNVIDFLSQYNETVRLEEIWNNLPEGEHIRKYNADPDNGVQFPMYEVCGRKVQSTVVTTYAYNVFNTFYKSYGKRAEKAARNEGIDWKAVSHALRCAYQMLSIYRNGDIVFPLPEAEEILKAKNGELDYMIEIAPKLESIMDEVEMLCAKSDLPKKVNNKKWDQWLLEFYE